MPRWFRPAFSLRQLLGVVVLAALASALAAKLISIRDFHRNGPASEALFRPMIGWHEYGIHSDAACFRTNRGSGVNHLAEAREHLARGVREIRREGVAAFHSFGPGRLRHLNRWPFRYALIETRSAYDCFQLAAKQRLRGVHHVHMRDYYLRLWGEHRIEIPPLPPELVAERVALQAELRRIGGIPPLDLEPEPLPSFLPGAPKPKATPVAPVSGGGGDSY